MLGSNNRRLFDPEQERRMRRWEMVAREDNKCEGLKGAKKLQEILDSSPWGNP
jgi:hypothetical protein